MTCHGIRTLMDQSNPLNGIANFDVSALIFCFYGSSVKKASDVNADLINYG